MTKRDRNSDDSTVTGVGTAIGAAFGDGIVGTSPAAELNPERDAARPTTLDETPDSADEGAPEARD